MIGIVGSILVVIGTVALVVMLLVLLAVLSRTSSAGEGILCFNASVPPLRTAGSTQGRPATSPAFCRRRVSNPQASGCCEQVSLATHPPSAFLR